LDDVDFDELLNDIEQQNSVSGDDSTLDIGDDILEGLDEVEQEDKASEEIKNNPEDFVSVDSLLSDSDESEEISEPYDKTSVDVGLDEFPEMTENINAIDVDQEDESGYSAKLDLAKVYIEMGDHENAEVALQDVLLYGDYQQKEEAKKLLNNLE
jgi:pilus assembly protein FimV